MSRPQWAAAAAVVAALLLTPVSIRAQPRSRPQVPLQYTWNLADIYPSDQAWRAATDKLQAGIPQMERFKGRLGTAATLLADALDQLFALQKDFYRASSYASMLADQDTRDAQHQGMRQEMDHLGASFDTQTSYLQPEILAIDRETLRKFEAAEPRLKVYHFYLDNIVRRAAHTLTDAEEKLLAGAGPMASTGSNTFALLSNAELPYPTVTLSDGRSTKLTVASFTSLRAVPNRVDREKVMSAFFQTLGSFSATLGAMMNGEVQQALFYSRARKYPSSQEAVLDGPNIPVSVYTRLIDGVTRSLPTFHRYLKLRKRMMGLDQLHYYDLYAPLVGSVSLSYTPEQAQGHILAALAPLGADYVSVLRRAMNERWIDLYPTDGKRAGAYSNGGVYDLHPYMLLNYNGSYSDMSTLAHELGHTMHSYYSNKTQPFPLAGYPIFVAEVASTFNESLLMDYMLKQIQEKDTRLALLGNYLENAKAAVFRQAQFAEFELRMHEMAQKGQPITGEALAKLYLEITRKYYGHDQGVCTVDDYVANEWSYVPHFYSNFYVYQYATSFAASAALAEKVKAGGPGGADATKRYLTFISSGGSNYPIDLLKNAGVDMTTDEPLDLTMRDLNRVMDEMERLLP